MKNKEIVARLSRIQKLIEKHTSAPKKRGRFKGHGETKPVAWLTELIREFDKERPKDKEIDENIWMAYKLGTSLYLWAHYVRYAKSQDPNRPLKIRRKAQNSWARDMQTIELVLNEMPGIKKVFQQKWDDPFDENATDGTFV